MEEKQASKWMVLATVAFGTLMATLDGSIVNIALPTIRTQLGAGDAVQWVVLSYLLTTTSTLLIMGKVSDMIGRKPVYIIGFIIFTFGSLLCGFSWDIWSLVIFRVIQGLGASMLFSIAPAIISDAFDKKERGRALGMMGTVVATGSSIGPVVGGLLLGKFGWQSIFFVNIPLGIIAIWRAWAVIPAGIKKMDQRFDFIGGLLFLISVTVLLCGLYFGPEEGWANPLVIIFITAGIILFVCFILWENKVSEPMLKLSTLKIKAFSASIAAAGISFTGAGGNLFILPFFLQQVRNFKPEHAGLIMLSGPLVLSVASPVGGYLADKLHARWISTIGLIIAASGYFLFSQLNNTWEWHDIVWRSAILSLGFGLFQSPNSSTALNTAPIEERGVSSSLLAFVRNLGMVLGIALAAAIWYSVRSAYAQNHTISSLTPEAQIAGMSVAYIVIGSLVLVAAFISFTRPKS